MDPIRIGLVADPDTPTLLARQIDERHRARPDRSDAWAVDVVSEAFTTGFEDVATALERLQDRAREHQWDAVVGLTELPLRDEAGRYLLIETDAQRRTAVLSLPALGGFRVHARARRELRHLFGGMSDVASEDGRRVPLPSTGGRSRLILGMVMANRPWRLVPGLKSALIAALATGAIATITSDIWMLASSMSGWRLAISMVASIALVVGWLVVDGGLWDRPADGSAAARERSRLYNTSTLLTLTTGVLLCYAALYLVNLAWALFVLDPEVMGDSLQLDLGYGDLAVLAWFVASAATVGGALGSSFESDDDIRAAAYSKREQDRRRLLADD